MRKLISEFSDIHITTPILHNGSDIINYCSMWVLRTAFRVATAQIGHYILLRVGSTALRGSTAQRERYCTEWALYTAQSEFYCAEGATSQSGRNCSEWALLLRVGTILLKVCTTEVRGATALRRLLIRVGSTALRRATAQSGRNSTEARYCSE